jgi:hypothetical protein
MTGTGVYAALFQQRFALARQRLKLDDHGDFGLATHRFAPRCADSPQLSLPL